MSAFSAKSSWDMPLACRCFLTTEAKAEDMATFRIRYIVPDWGLATTYYSIDS